MMNEENSGHSWEPEPPPPPLSRIIREGDVGLRCGTCHSSLYKKHWWSQRSSYCINPQCENYRKAS